MRTRLTDRNINTRLPATGTIELWDAVVPGLHLRIHAGGRRTYAVMTRIFDAAKGKPIQIRKRIGTTDTHRLSEAREAARGILRDAARDIDPRKSERRERREAHKARQDTFAAIAEMYMTERGGKRKSGTELQRKLDVDI